MARILFANNASDTLNGAINGSVTTITLNDASEFYSPSGDEIAYATIDDGTNIEIITYTGVSTNDLTGVTRGVDNTTGTAFADAVTIEQRMVAAVVNTYAQGPGSSTDNAFPRFDSTTGKLLQNGQTTEDDSGNVSVAGNISVTGTVDGRDIATDGTKLDGIEAAADVTDETNVTNALDNATLTDVGTPASGDLILLQDASDTNALKVAQFSEFAGGGGSVTTGAFKAYRNTTQTLTAATHTKIQLNAEVFDVDGTFDSTTNYRHTPTTAGRYLYYGTILFNSPSDQNQLIPEPYKNGSVVSQTTISASGTAGHAINFIAEIDMNGSTDYVELYAYRTSSGTLGSATGGSVSEFALHMGALYIGDV